MNTKFTSRFILIVLLFVSASRSFAQCTITATAHNPTTCLGSNGSIVVCGLTAGANYKLYYTHAAVNDSQVNRVANAVGCDTILNLSSAIYTNIHADSGTCHSNVLAGPFTLSDPTPPAHPVASYNGPLCVGDTLKLFASTIANATYSWSAVTGCVASASTSQNPVIPNVLLSCVGWYKVTATVNNCTSTADSVLVVINTLPVPSISPASPLNVCIGSCDTLHAGPLGAGYSYQWFHNGTSITGATADSLIACPLSSSSYTVRVTNTTTGCKATSALDSITVHALPLDTVTALGPLTFCIGDSVKLKVAPTVGATYQWRKGTVDIPTATDTIYKAITPGNYSVKVTGLFGCILTSSAVQVIVDTLPFAHITPASSPTFCLGDSVRLNALGHAGYTYIWKLDGVTIPGATSDHYYASQPGHYRVIVHSNTCPGADTSTPPILVTVNPLPVPVVTQNGTILSTDNYYVSYQWLFMNITIPFGGTASLYSPLVAGTYAVTVTDTNGCTGTSAPFTYTPPTSVHELNNQFEKVNIYPNPANAIIHIASKQLVNIAIKDLSGRVLIAQAQAHTIDISSLTTGIYFLQILDTDNRLMHVEKLIKE